VVGITGYATAGKDTAAAGLLRHKWIGMHFADAVREGLLAIDPYVQWEIVGVLFRRVQGVRLKEVVARLGWEKAKKLPEVRRLLQRYGTEAGRNIHGENCWVEIAQRAIGECLSRPGVPGVFFPDVRFPNEVALIREVYGGKVLLVRREGVGPCNTHASERLQFDADAVLTNDGSQEHLQRKLINIMRAFGYQL
jgi:hypothetical protein